MFLNPDRLIQFLNPDKLIYLQVHRCFAKKKNEIEIKKESNLFYCFTDYESSHQISIPQSNFSKAVFFYKINREMSN